MESSLQGSVMTYDHIFLTSHNVPCSLCLRPLRRRSPQAALLEGDSLLVCLPSHDPPGQLDFSQRTTSATSSTITTTTRSKIDSRIVTAHFGHSQSQISAREERREEATLLLHMNVFNISAYYSALVDYNLHSPRLRSRLHSNIDAPGRDKKLETFRPRE